MGLQIGTYPLEILTIDHVLDFVVIHENQRGNFLGHKGKRLVRKTSP
jgi:hypothetical protein